MNDKLTLKEKASLLVGNKTMTTFSIPQKGVEEIMMSDGPNGLRYEDQDGDSLSNMSKTKPATCFPCGVTLASSWNVDLAHKMGAAMGEECVSFGVNVLLGPAVNIQRNPLCGRNFEYLSEDPILAGYIGANLVKGIQSQGVGACMKHYACNNNEKWRYVGDSIVDLRALHEIYLKPFEIIVKKADPRAVMTAYNQINGTFASENEYLIEEVLRKSWGFDGVVMTDWGGMVHRDIALNHGCDLEMPGMIDYNIKLIYDGVKNGTIKEETVDQSINRIIDLRNRTDIKEKKPCSFKDHYQVALSIALDGAVLLKNNNHLLPLSKDKKYLVIGGLFSQMRYQGSGSSLLYPAMIKDHKQAFEENHIFYDFVMGYKENETEPDIKLEEQVVNAAKEADTIIFYGGLNDYVESEGYDRDNMSIPQNQLSLLDKLTKLGKKIVLVLFGGSPVELPFFDSVDSILSMMLPGEAGGEATTKLLFGEVCPSGKLSQSWPYLYKDVPFGDEFTSSPNELYKESIFVGYRYYNTVNKAVRFPFGYGLSYTTFSYSNLKIKEESNGVIVSFKIKNTGEYKGKEISQLYISKKGSSIVRPTLELKGFDKVELEPGEEKEVSIFVKYDSLGVFVDNSFKVESGEYQIFVGGSSKDIYLEGKINVKGESLSSGGYDEIYKDYLTKLDMNKETFEKVIGRTITDYEVNKKPYTLETPIWEFDTFWGKIFKKATCDIGLKQYKKACKKKDSLEKEREKKTGLFIYKVMANNCLRSLSFSSSGLFKYHFAKGILELANGHFFKGIGEMCKRYKIK